MLSSRPPNILQENPHHRAFASKTPGRHGAQHTMAGGLKSAMRKENALVPKTTVGRSKMVKGLVDESIEPKRLFKDASSSKPLSTLGKGLSDVTNKTPAPAKRVPLAFKTPLPGASSKPLKLAPLLSASAESTESSHPGPHTAPRTSLEPPPSALRPSSSRRTSRIIRSSSSKSFETPAPGLRRPHWDVSEGEISVAGLSDEEVREAEEELGEGEEEIEYMAPTAWIEPYTPPFPLPDYKALCTKVLEISRIPAFGDPNEDFFDPSYLDTWIPPECGEEELKVPLRPLVEDEFFGPPLPAVQAPLKRPSTRTPLGCTMPKVSAATRSGVASAARPPVARSQASSALSRPASRPLSAKPPISRPMSAKPAPTRPVSAAQAAPRTGSAASLGRQLLQSTRPGGVSRLVPSKPASKPAEAPKPDKPSDTLPVFLAPPEFGLMDDDFRFDV